MNPKNYYETLGVQRNATKDEIKKAYHKLAHKYHPDKKGGDEARFKEVNEAYQILSDDKKRAEYDRYGRVFGNTGGFSGQAGFDFSGFSAQAGQAGFDFGDIFEEFFGGAGGFGARHVRRGRDISIDIELSFEEAVFGCRRKVLLSKLVSCEKCKGEGREPGSALKTCSLCRGEGKVRETKRSFFGVFSAVKECDGCLGKGKVPEKQCSSCRGKGVAKQSKESTIVIPPGIGNGEIIKLSGEGEAISGGISGDLYIKIHVLPHSVFIREGNNILMDLDIKFSEAVLGVKT
jgi:molecular chaperone DnaJ